MTWYYEGREIEEEEIYAIVVANYDWDDFEEDLNEMYSHVRICEEYFEQGTALRRVNAFAFKCKYEMECDEMARDITYRKDETDCYDFGIHWVKEEVVE